MNQPERDERLVFPDLEEEFGEEAIRDAVSTLHRDHIGRVKPHLYDLTIQARIRGIDFFDRIRVFAAVENRTRGREEVLEALQDRREELEEIGERDERMEGFERQPVQESSEKEEKEPVYRHEECGAVVRQTAERAWYCSICDVRTNRVQEIESPDPDEPIPGQAVADGGGSS